jgi:hypothetical protein
MMNSKRYIGCCGAYCKTCKPFIEGACKGCKIGFDTGERGINKAAKEVSTKPNAKSSYAALEIINLILVQIVLN